MSIFQWKDEYSVDHSEIDAQHKRMFQLADELHSAMAAGKGNASLSQTLTTLVDYTKHRFACEERLMQAHRYPEFVKHKASHDELTARVAALTHHIGETNRRAAAYLSIKAA